MIDIENKSSLEIDTKILKQILKYITKKNVELIITNNKEIQEINKNHRGIDKATDVLSFAYKNIPIAGSIIISYDYIDSVSRVLSHSKNDELCLLFIHGLLHIIGFNHETDNGQMREEEERIIKKFNLPTSLITRTQG